MQEDNAGERWCRATRVTPGESTNHHPGSGDGTGGANVKNAVLQTYKAKDSMNDESVIPAPAGISHRARFRYSLCISQPLGRSRAEPAEASTTRQRRASSSPRLAGQVALRHAQCDLGCSIRPPRRRMLPPTAHPPNVTPPHITCSKIGSWEWSPLLACPYANTQPR